MELKDIDIAFDVQMDSRGKDPDWASATLKAYHQLLWNKPLPNGNILALESGKDCYLKGNGFYFGSDSITATFRNGRNKHFDEFKAAIPNYDEYEKQNLSKLYTIGGAIIFPQTPWSMNRARGCHPRICDRWDLTLECIRRFYNGESSPLDKSIQECKEFFEWFIDFKGYVDFFLLQDCVDDNYDVKFWLETALFDSNPIPQDIGTYLAWVDTQLEFAEKRNRRILNYCQTNR
jgi:hypothetical protein